MKKELEHQGRKYAREAISFRDKIAELALGFIKDDSIVRPPHHRPYADAYRTMRIDPHSLVLARGAENVAPCPQDEANFSIRDRITAQGLRVNLKKLFAGGIRR